MSAATEHGLYRPGRSPLHLADPRVKTLACLLLVMLCFAAAGWRQLGVVGLAAAAGALFGAPAGAMLWRLWRMLRWLLLFTLLMHLCFSPGRTLWGSSWLSLDGLLAGGYVCLQLVLALTLSALMAACTLPAALAATFGWLVRPLRRLGCRTDEWERQLLLAMDFVPLVHAEMSASARPAGVVKAGLRERWAGWESGLRDLLWRLADRCDAMAVRLAADGDGPPLQALPPLLPMARRDLLLVAALALCVTLYWLA